jgi:hypothetical protein
MNKEEREEYKQKTLKKLQGDIDYYKVKLEDLQEEYDFIESR